MCWPHSLFNSCCLKKTSYLLAHVIIITKSTNTSNSSLLSFKTLPDLKSASSHIVLSRIIIPTTQKRPAQSFWVVGITTDFNQSRRLKLMTKQNENVY